MATVADIPDGISLEYSSLREEILKRIELRQQLISITLTLAGLFLSFGLTTELVPLIYPPIAAFLAIGWAQNDGHIGYIAAYIREHIEKPSNGLDYGLHFETVTEDNRKKDKKVGWGRFIVMSHSGLFLLTQAMAVGVEIAKSPSLPYPPLKWILLAIDLISIVVAAWATSKSRQ